MKIVNLVCGNRRPQEKRQSYMRESALLRRAPGPIFALHHAIIRGGTPKGNTISVIVGAHASKGTAPGNATLEMVYMRRFKIRSGWLIVAAVFVQPRNRIGVGAAVGRAYTFLCSRRKRHGQRKPGTRNHGIRQKRSSSVEE